MPADVPPAVIRAAAVCKQGIHTAGCGDERVIGASQYPVRRKSRQYVPDGAGHRPLDHGVHRTPAYRYGIPEIR